MWCGVCSVFGVVWLVSGCVCLCVCVYCFVDFFACAACAPVRRSSSNLENSWPTVRSVSTTYFSEDFADAEELVKDIVKSHAALPADVQEKLAIRVREVNAEFDQLKAMALEASF